MGFFKRLKKKVKKVGKQVARSSKKIGRQVKRSAAVAAPALLGPGLGEKVGVAIAKTAGKTAIKSTYSGMGRVSNVTGRVVQVVATAVTTWFGGPILGAAAYRGTALLRQLSQHEIAEAKYKAGVSQSRGHNVVWKKQPVRIIEGLAVGLGGAIAGAAAGGTSVFASGSSMVSGILGTGGAAAGAGGTGASAAMQSSTAAMVAGETGGVATAASGGIGTMGYISAATGVLGIAQRFLGGGAGTTSGGGAEGSVVENIIGDQGVLGSEGPLGENGLGIVSEDGSFMGTGIPMIAVVIAVLALIAYLYFA